MEFLPFHPFSGCIFTFFCIVLNRPAIEAGLRNEGCTIARHRRAQSVTTSCPRVLQAAQRAISIPRKGRIFQSIGGGDLLWADFAELLTRNAATRHVPITTGPFSGERGEAICGGYAAQRTPAIFWFLFNRLKRNPPRRAESPQPKNRLPAGSLSVIGSVRFR